MDTSVLINLANVDRMDLLTAFPDLGFCSPAEVLEEITYPRQRSLARRALQCGDLREIPLVEPVDLVLYAELLRIMGSGEAACLALAARRDALVACDEKRVFRREAESRLGPGRILDTPGLLLLALRRGVLTVAEADDLKHRLEGQRFRMTFESFGELL